MKKKILLLPILSLALCGCTIQDLMFWKKKDEDSNQKDNDESKKEEQPEEETDNRNKRTVTISFCDDAFKIITSGEAGYVFADHPESINEYVSSKAGGDDYLSGFEFENLNTAVYKSVLYLCVGTGYYANSKFKEGSFTWTSKKDIYDIEIKVKAYSKLDSGGSTDIQSVAWIDNESVSLNCESTADPESKVKSVKYANGTKQFTVKATGSRVMLEYLKISWEA